MKKLIIVRHAKSSWEHEVGDRHRPLKNRGMSDATLVSNKFKMKQINLDAVFSSPAKRAFETCKIFSINLDFSYKNVQISEDLYDFGGRKVTNFVKSLDNNYKTVMIFGHNHALTDFVNFYGDQYIDNVTTSGLVVIKFDIDDWTELTPGRTVEVIFPRHLKR